MPLAHALRNGELALFANEAKTEGTTRVCCISDTHLVHDQLVLPEADVLVHAGDVMTESLLRHVTDKGEVKSQGEALFVKFAEWFCAQPHRFKVLIAGNHDGAMQAMGAARIREVLARCGGNVVYLEHETASVGRLKVFGSPFGNWGSHNNAFSIGERTFESVEQGTHILITHSPPVLPSSRERGKFSEHEPIVNAAVRCGVQLSVSGHCHWAYGSYRCAAAPNGPAFVVASNCGGGWNKLMSLEGKRLDSKWDLLRGGYNVRNPPIVADIVVEPPLATDTWVIHSLKRT